MTHNKPSVCVVWFVFGLVIGFMMSERQNESVGELTANFRELSKQNVLLNSKLSVYEQKYNALYKMFTNKCGTSYVNVD